MPRNYERRSRRLGLPQDAADYLTTKLRPPRTGVAELLSLLSHTNGSAMKKKYANIPVIAAALGLLCAGAGSGVATLSLTPPASATTKPAVTIDALVRATYNLDQDVKNANLISPAQLDRDDATWTTDCTNYGAPFSKAPAIFTKALNAAQAGAPAAQAADTWLNALLTQEVHFIETGRAVVPPASPSPKPKLPGIGATINIAAFNPTNSAYSVTLLQVYPDWTWNNSSANPGSHPFVVRLRISDTGPVSIQTDIDDS